MRTKNIVSLVAVLFCLSSLAVAKTEAQEATTGSKPSVSTPLPIDSVVFARTRYGLASLSADGNWLAYAVKDPRRALESNAAMYVFNDKGSPSAADGTDVWLLNVRTKVAENLTGGVGSNWGPVWSPDGKRFAFYSDRDGRAGLWIYEQQRGIRRVADVTTRANAYMGDDVLLWSPDSTKVLTKVLAAGDPIALAVGSTGHRKATTAPISSQTEPTVTVFRWPPPKTKDKTTSSGTGIFLSPAGHADLALIDVRTGNVERIASGFNVTGYGFSPDGSRIAFVADMGGHAGDINESVFDLYIVGFGEAPRLLSHGIRSAWPLRTSWSPDGKRLAFTALPKRDEEEFFVVPSNGGETRKVDSEEHPTFKLGSDDPPIWSPDGMSLYVNNDYRDIWQISLRDGSSRVAIRIPGQRVFGIVGAEGRYWSTDAGRSMTVLAEDESNFEWHYYEVDLATKGLTKLFGGHKVYHPAGRLPDFGSPNRILLEVQDANHPPDVWAADPNFKNLERLTHINPEWDKYTFGQAEDISWRSGDGAELHGSLWLPSDYEAGKRYPLVVDVYPHQNGAAMVNAFGGYHSLVGNVHLLTSRGYAVLFPEIPVTAGPGAMSQMAKAVLPGVNQAVNMGIADPNRIGVIGGSWGGYAVLSLIAQSTWFKAAISLAGFGDLFGAYAEMNDMGATYGLSIVKQDIADGTPWQHPERYIQDSPIFYFDRVQTPLLIVQGDLDPAVAPFLADEVFVDLRSLNKEVEYAQYPGEGHGLSNPENRIDGTQREIQWLDDHLKGPLQSSDAAIAGTESAVPTANTSTN